MGTALRASARHVSPTHRCQESNLDTVFRRHWCGIRRNTGMRWQAVQESNPVLNRFGGDLVTMTYDL